MKRNSSIQLKAAFLLLVFAMNTLVGLACSVGMVMGFKANHHEKAQTMEAPIHVHADGKKHEHSAPVKTAVYHHADGKQHEHAAEKNKLDQEHSPASDKEDCCTDQVVKLQSVEKNLTPKTSLDAPAFVAILSTFLTRNIFSVTRAFPPKRLVRFFYPPPPDILISIQKFQV